MINKVIANIFSDFDTNTTLLTPNRRLSATLHKLYQQFQLTQNKQTWLTPDILPINSWIQRLWDNHTAQHISKHPLLLNSIQERYLWEKVIITENQQDYFLQVSETAELARSAWGLLKQWRVDINHPIFQCTEDYLAFNAWANAFHALCEKNQYLDHASLVDKVIVKIIGEDITPPKKIILYGFTDLSPQYEYLLECCVNTGCAVTQVELEQEQSDIHAISLPDNEAEISTMARWAKAKYFEDDTRQIACVIPDLDKMRDRVWQLFSEVFTHNSANKQNKKTALFNISAGKNLTQYPVINAALQLLALYKNKIALANFSMILSSPFIGEAENERIRRANFDSLLRQNNIITVNLQHLIQENLLENRLSLTKSCAALSHRLRDFFAIIEQHQEKYCASGWVKIFAELLSALGWPGERSLSSEEYQVVECWLNLLNDFSSLDKVCDTITFTQALHLLQKLAGKTIFQAQTPDAPIQVLGMLEAAALPFDYLWVAGLDDLSWPPQPKPNPFIPKKLQRELHMPHATAERELIYCEQITKQFKQSTPHVIFSHAEKTTELELQASPLIRDLPKLSLAKLELLDYITPSEKLFLSKKIDLLLDSAGPSLLADEKIRGGVSVIKQQASCPFRAFAEWRLHARELETPVPGLRAKDRGTLMHKALEITWDTIKNQEKLLSLSEEELLMLIESSINMAVSSTPYSHAENPQYIGLEKTRLRSLIFDWMQVEKQREPFAIATNEKSIEMTLNKLSLSMRIDRIDQLADGKKLIIDYKTGKNLDIKDWFSDRPEEPQLPLYALLDPENTIGITFAQIYPGKYCFNGVSCDDLNINGIKSITEISLNNAASWAEQLTHWQAILSQLSDHFVQGKANVDPKDGKQTCKYCALRPLCRVNEENDAYEYAD